MTRKALFILTVITFLIGCSASTPQQAQPVKHIILWTLNDSVKGNQREDLIRTACEDCQSLKGKIPGLISLRATFEGRLPSSNCDFMFEMTFESEKALLDFSNNPEHLKNAQALKPYIKSRACFDVLLQE